MFLKPPFSLPQSSGFVAFDGGGSAETDVRPTARRSADFSATPRLEPELVRAAEPAREWQGSAAWQPSTSGLVRRVEGLVVVAICGYFAFGLASVAGWL